MKRLMFVGIGMMVILTGCGQSGDDDDGTIGTPISTIIPADGDGDGWTPAEGDCNDEDPAIHPGAQEACDELDQDCDGDMNDGQTLYRDLDGDGWGDRLEPVESCYLMAGYVTTPGDCDDANDEAYPGAPEYCDGVDNDCNGTNEDDYYVLYYLDEDGDRYGLTDHPEESCSVYVSDVTDPNYHWAVVGGDCDDTEGAVNPGAVEICGNGRDEDCDGLDLACSL